MSRIKHGTLAAAVVATETVDAFTQQITVVNRSQTGEIYFTVDGSTPTVKGNDTYICLGAKAVSAYSYTSASTVKLISATGPLEYSVVGEAS